ncbi:phosphoglycerate kinase [Candidatus Campbellbacteria bacterium]|nr:phosphoglycerate kinase [Candidatus Campbellbacteria bacterium]
MNIVEQVKNRSIATVDDLKGKKVIVRIDVNTSLGENGTVDPGEDWRILKSYRTIEYLLEREACVILISHIGRDPEESLKPVYEYMKEHFTLGFIPHWDAQVLEHTIENMQHGSVVMLENVRQFDEEKNNNLDYLNNVIAMADYYVNDAFSVSHRNHASVSAITEMLPSYFGLQFADEVTHVAKALDPSKKSVLLLGGAKFGTKIDLLEKLLPQIEYALVGGALANVFLDARGIDVGASFKDDVDISHMVENPKIVLPIDAVDQHGDIISVDEVRKEDMILDIGHATEKVFEKIIDQAEIVVWNGPMGKYEDGYVSGSVAMADALSKSKAFSVTGGGDTATVILEEDLVDDFDFISTGGGAMLDFMVDGTLPAIDALLKNNS